MTSTIYKSTFPDVFIPDQSLFTHILPEKDLYSRSLPASIDVQLENTINLGKMRDNALRLAAGLVGPN